MESTHTPAPDIPTMATPTAARPTASEESEQQHNKPIHPEPSTNGQQTDVQTNDSERKEAEQHWGYLFRQDKCGTDRLNRLLQGIARYIAAHFEPNDCPDLTPSQLAAFYRSVGGNYDILFVETPPPSIAFIYKSLGCLHSLQPAADSDGYQLPSIPALKVKGFVTWQTIQLLLGPEEHVPFLQNAVKQFDIVDPVDGTPFPKILPKECFPDRPDDQMLDWYDTVSEKLRVEAQHGAHEAHPAEAANGAGGAHDHVHVEEWSSADEKSDAAEYFANPMCKDRGGRPTIIRRYSRASPRSPRDYVADRGRAVVHHVRHLINPRARGRRRSSPEDYDEVLDDDITSTGLHPRYVPRTSRQRHHSTESNASSFEEIPARPSRSPRRPSRSPRRTSSRSPRRPSKSSPKDEEPKRSPTLRHRRSHSPPPSPREYFPPYENHHRRHSEQMPSPEVGIGVGFAPSKAPPFAAQVAQMSAYNGRPVLRDRVNDYRDRDHNRERDRPRDRDRDRERDRLSAPTSSSTRYGRSSADLPERPRFGRPSYVRAPRSRDRFDRQNRSQSDDRLYGRDFDRERDRDKDRERDRHSDRDRRPTHRYVMPVDGVGGRRYHVPDWR